MNSLLRRFVRRCLVGCAIAAVSVPNAFAQGPIAELRANTERYFQRIAHFPVFLNTDVDEETVAEIVAASDDGNTLIYTDSELELVGFVDITNPASPVPAGTVELSGEPTSVAVAGNYALVAVNTSVDFVTTSGELVVIDLTTQMMVETFDLFGQPDSVAVSPDKRFAAVVIENERDEDLGDGEPPQAPAGSMTIFDLVGEPADWTSRDVSFVGIPNLFPTDPEPEYVDINKANVAVVSFQENNHLALVHLPSGRVYRNWEAGTVDLEGVDIAENDFIELTGSLAEVPREPDGVSWVSPLVFATADEGDLFGGSRGFTLYGSWGGVLFSSGNTLDQMAVRVGHYPENRSENKGNEPENVEYGRFGANRFLFVGSERANLIFVYRLGLLGRNELVQVLPTGVGPEGLLAIPQRNLLVAASEKDDRGDKFRSRITIYSLTAEVPVYPTVESADREDGTPIPWGALSGLAVAPDDEDRAYTVHDSFYAKSRIFALDLSTSPAVIDGEIVLSDSGSALSAVDPGLVNGDAEFTVNLDLEGIAVSPAGGFWLVSEGSGAAGDGDEVLNLLLKVSATGVIEDVVTLPDAVNDFQIRFGFEGVAAVAGESMPGAVMTAPSEQVFVAFQREWDEDPDGLARIGRYDTGSGEWAFYYYPLEEPESDNGGWVGLSDLTYLGDERFAVIERDNQAGTDAVIKRIYRFSVARVEPLPEPSEPAATDTAVAPAVMEPAAPKFPVLEKTLVRDLVPDLEVTAGPVLEKIEGLAALADGTALVVNDNDGVDDSNGETQLLRLNATFVGEVEL